METVESLLNETKTELNLKLAQNLTISNKGRGTSRTNAYLYLS